MYWLEEKKDNLKVYENDFEKKLGLTFVLFKSQRI